MGQYERVRGPAYVGYYADIGKPPRCHSREVCAEGASRAPRHLVLGTGQPLPLGSMVINSVCALSPLCESALYSLPSAPTLADLDSESDSGELVAQQCEVWFLDCALYWHFLTESSTAYCRLMVTHLGLPE
ncbi:tubulin polyglutamylase complex subunit 2-like isoform X8 [Polyodon spathula]|uniref:tubulin polyglutamylase complex subunit 2-like isoform X8 n=1 Tax=Polyodon spathula TaxID=7913 RepID=UPI001B7DF16D|nr:tubulin polyglutamylase complex subunit 2-like isoform X8 [Polyodon spathula]